MLALKIIDRNFDALLRGTSQRHGCLCAVQKIFVDKIFTSFSGPASFRVVSGGKFVFHFDGALMLERFSSVKRMELMLY